MKPFGLFLEHCARCEDTGILPGYYFGTLCVSPRPCTCRRGEYPAYLETRAVERLARSFSAIDAPDGVTQDRLA